MAVAHLQVRRTRRRRRSIPHFPATRGLALALVCTLAPTACGVFGGGGGVVLFGDSLTVLVTKDVQEGGRPDFDVTSEATWGLRIDEQIDAAAKVAAQHPDQVVVNLGTNNVLQAHDTVASIEDLHSLLDQLTDVRCVHLVTINEQMRRLGVDFSAQAAALNTEIRRLAARRLNTDVIDWNKIVVEHAADNIMDADTVHPNPAGVKILSAAYLSAIKRC